MKNKLYLCIFLLMCSITYGANDVKVSLAGVIIPIHGLSIAYESYLEEQETELEFGFEVLYPVVYEFYFQGKKVIKKSKYSQLELGLEFSNLHIIKIGWDLDEGEDVVGSYFGVGPVLEYEREKWYTSSTILLLKGEDSIVPVPIVRVGLTF